MFHDHANWVADCILIALVTLAFLIQEIVEHLEESTAFRYLAQYYFKCKLWDEASTCAQKCCAFNDVSSSSLLKGLDFRFKHMMFKRHVGGSVG